MRSLDLARAALLGAAAVLSSLAGGERAEAATYTIGNGDVAALKAAILAANASPGLDTIILAANGSYTLTTVEAHFTGLPSVNDPLEIVGNNAVIERSFASGTPQFRLIRIGAGGSLILRNVTLRNGRFIDLNGNWHGGAIYANGDLTIIGSTLSGNQARRGGAIHAVTGHLKIENSTLSGNGAVSGGAILANYSSGWITIVSSTFLGNGSPERASALDVTGFSVTLRNSVIASPANGTAPECLVIGGSMQSLGHNIIGDTSCALNGLGDIQGSSSFWDPQLGPLTTHGTTLIRTHPPLAGSPAINAVPTSDCVDLTGSPLLIDQRGVSRPIGAACDVGAHESRMGHSVQQSYAVGPIETSDSIDTPLQAHLTSASEVHDRRLSLGSHDRRLSETHDARRSEAHDPRRSETHDRRLSETHDARRSEAHDPRRSETHDRRLSETHDARRSDAHDPRRSETHDRRLSETHDARRSEAHDPRRSETHDRRLSETHDARRSEAHDSRRSETHDRRLSETHDVRRSELTPVG